VVKAGGLQLSDDRMQCFTDIDDSRFLGDDLVAFGYPADVLGPDATLPVPRLFRGHIQRFIPEFDGGRYRFPAAELSFRCPGGLSGGPVFSLHRPSTVLAMATANLRSITVLESFEERPGHTVHYREMNSYGVALTLTAVREWLDEHCPPREDYSQPASQVR
jgi:hypothetical protein